MTLFESTPGQALLLLAFGALVAVATSLILKFRQRQEMQQRVEEAIESERQAKMHAIALTRDSHHQTKNSFTFTIRLISSIERKLRATDAQVVDKELILEGLKGLSDQLYGMAALQSMLHDPNNVSGVSMQEFFVQVVEHLVNTNVRTNPAIEWSVDCGDISCDMRRMRDYGVILVELVTNSLKHAFSPTTASPKLTVTARVSGKELILSVHDNGHGVPDGFRLDDHAGSGIGIIQLLLDQEHGTLFCESGEEGTTFEITLAFVDSIV